MSIAVAVKTPQALVLATDSRLTVVVDHGNGRRETCGHDWAQKVWVPGPPNPSLAVSFYGDAQLSGGSRALGDLIAEWARAQGTRQTIEAAAGSLHAFIAPKIRSVTLLVAGYDETAYYGRVFELSVPGGVTERHAGGSGVTLGGQRRVAEAVLGQLGVPFEQLSPRGAVEFARFLIGAEIAAQPFHLGHAGVGGAVQVAVLERNKMARLE